MDPLLNAAPPIPMHAFAALAAIVLGAVQLVLPKGTMLHRSLGWTWVILMTVVAVSSFFISEMRVWGAFSPIHLLSALTLFSLVLSIRAARSGQLRRHMQGMRMMYGLALLLTGAFTLLPGRIMHQVLFGT